MSGRLITGLAARRGALVARRAWRRRPERPAGRSRRGSARRRPRARPRTFVTEPPPLCQGSVPCRRSPRSIPPSPAGIREGRWIGVRDDPQPLRGPGSCVLPATIARPLPGPHVTSPAASCTHHRPTTSPDSGDPARAADRRRGSRGPAGSRATIFAGQARRIRRARDRHLDGPRQPSRTTAWMPSPLGWLHRTAVQRARCRRTRRGPAEETRAPRRRGRRRRAASCRSRDRRDGCARR